METTSQHELVANQNALPEELKDDNFFGGNEPKPDVMHVREEPFET